MVHIRTGTGYYTAILAQFVGPSGRVTGIEYEPELAVRARTNLATYPNVDIVEGDGALVSFDAATADKGDLYSEQSEKCFSTKERG